MSSYSTRFHSSWTTLPDDFNLVGEIQSHLLARFRTRRLDMVVACSSPVNHHRIVVGWLPNVEMLVLAPNSRSTGEDRMNLTTNGALSVAACRRLVELAIDLPQPLSVVDARTWPMPSVICRRSGFCAFTSADSTLCRRH
jgi:hypothetical protein